MSGPLDGLKVLELAGIGPGPFATMTLADLGAEVVRIDRPGGSDLFPGTPRQDVLNRGKRSVVLDLKQPAAVEAVLTMVERADVLVEGYRPGVTERLGLGPDACWERNSKLVYGRMTGWGQTGPLAQTSGHDVNYIALTGALHAIGEAGGAPQIPINLVGDFGGGGAYLVIGILAALREAELSGQGQVVDAAIVDGAAHLLSAIHGFVAAGQWSNERGTNLLDGGAPFYSVYETSDGRHMAVGALEAKFYAQFVSLLGVNIATETQMDRSTWAGLRKAFADAFASRTQAEWATVFEGTDACVAPVATMQEALNHPHVAARGTIVDRSGVLQAAPAPRFSRTAAVLDLEPPLPGEHSAQVLTDWGIADADELIRMGVASGLSRGSTRDTDDKWVKASQKGRTPGSPQRRPHASARHP